MISDINTDNILYEQNTTHIEQITDFPLHDLDLSGEIDS